MPKRAGFPPEFGILLVASFALGFAVAISHGQYLEPALACIVVALALLAWSLFSQLRGRGDSTSRMGLVSGLALAALVSMPITSMCDPKLVVYHRGPLFFLRGIEVASLGLLATYAPFLFGAKRERRALRHARFAIFGALTLAGGIATIRLSPAPIIDVWDVQMRGAEALLRGENPYVTVTVADTAPEWHALGHTRVPFVYSPGSLYLGAIALLVAGDVRYAMLFAILVAGALLRVVARRATPAEGLAFPSLIEDAPALFVWCMPPLFFILELAWIDPVQLMFVCMAVAAYLVGAPSLAAVAIGLALASKQSMFWLVPLAGLVFRFRLRTWAVLFATWGMIVAPFVIADYQALKYATVDSLLAMPSRSDALCAPVWFRRTLGWSPPGAIAAIGAAAIVGATVVAARRFRGPAQSAQAWRASIFATSAALVYLFFFFFSKFAFANYYFLVAGLAALAAAASLRTSASRAGV